MFENKLFIHKDCLQSNLANVESVKTFLSSWNPVTFTSVNSTSLSVMFG